MSTTTTSVEYVETFDGFLATFGQLVWSNSARRRAARHGGRRCPQRMAPLGLFQDPGRVRCDLDCQSVWADEMMMLRGRFLRSGGAAMANPTAWISKTAASAAFAEDMRRIAAGQDGLVQRPKRTVEAAWMVRAVPDPLDRQLVELLLFFVGSQDRTAGGRALPTDRWAAKLELTEGEVELRINRALLALIAADPVWMTEQVDRPLSRMLSRHSVGDERLRNLTSLTATDDDPVLLARQALDLIDAGASQLEAIALVFGAEVAALL